jgi:hypothetical protein
MNNVFLGKLILIPILIFSVMLLSSCDKKSTEPEHEEHAAEVELTITPDPATVNTVINFKFEVEENGEHVDVTMVKCEIEKAGTGNHQEMTLTPEQGETGHYTGTWTFAEAATYEIHFEFMHDGEMSERKFDLTVQ